MGILDNRTACLMAALVVGIAASGCKGKQGGEAPRAKSGREAATPSTTKETSASKPVAAQPSTPQAGSGGCPDRQTRVPEAMSTWEISLTFEKYPASNSEEAKIWKSDVELEVLEATTTEFYGKPLTLVGELELSNDFYGKYREAKPTHYSFSFHEIADHLPNLNVYAEKAKFKKLFEHVVKHKFSFPFRVRVVTDAGHEWDSVFTLLEVEPATAWMRGQCAHKMAAAP